MIIVKNVFPGHEPLPNNMYIPLIVLVFSSTLLSFVGSSCIVHTSRRDADKMMHRLLFILSICDIVTSVTMFLTPIIIPSEMDLPLAIGTTTSCAVSGFFFMISYPAGSFYNCYLSIYFLLTVKYNWREDDFKRKRTYEIILHVITFVLAIAYSSAAFATKSLNPHQLVNICQLAKYPWGCETDIPELKCERSNTPTVFAFGASMIIALMIATITGFYCTFSLYYTVRSKLRSGRTFEFNEDAERNNNKRIREVATQAILYSSAYLNTFLWPTVVALITPVHTNEYVQEHKSNSLYPFIVLCYFLCPMQGFLNFFIYMHPKIKRWRKMDAEISMLQIFSNILNGKPIPTRQTTTSSSSHKKSNNILGSIARRFKSNSATSEVKPEEWKDENNEYESQLPEKDQGCNSQVNSDKLKNRDSE